MNYVLFLSEETREAATVDADTLRQHLRAGRIRPEDDIYVAEMNRHYAAADAVRLLSQGVIAPRHATTPPVPPGSVRPEGHAKAAGSGPMTSPAADRTLAKPAMTTATKEPLRALAQVPQSVYYEDADRLLESYARQYRQLESALTRAILLVPLLGCGFLLLRNVLAERAALLRRVNQAGFPEMALHTALYSGGAFRVDVARRRRIAAIVVAAGVSCGYVAAAIIAVRHSLRAPQAHPAHVVASGAERNGSGGAITAAH